MTGHSSDPSIDVDKQRPEAARLAERCIAYKGQVEAGAAEIARLTAALARAEEKLTMLDGTLTLERGFGIDTHATMLAVAKRATARQIELEKRLSRCKEALAKIVAGTKDEAPPLRAMPRETMVEIATEALSSISEPVK